MNVFFCIIKMLFWYCQITLNYILFYFLLLNWWGGDDGVPCACTHVRCYASDGVRVWMMAFLALAHMWDATQVMGWGCGVDDDVPCTCTHVRCYAADPDVLIQMTLLLYFLMVYQCAAWLHALQACFTIPRNENWGPAGCSAPPPVTKLLLSPPFLKTKQGTRLFFWNPPRTTTVKKRRFLLFPFSYTSHFHLFARTQDPSQTLTQTPYGPP